MSNRIHTILVKTYPVAFRFSELDNSLIQKLPPIAVLQHLFNYDSRNKVLKRLDQRYAESGCYLKPCSDVVYISDSHGRRKRFKAIEVVFALVNGYQTYADIVADSRAPHDLERATIQHRNLVPDDQLFVSGSHLEKHTNDYSASIDIGYLNGVETDRYPTQSEALDQRVRDLLELIRLNNIVGYLK